MKLTLAQLEIEGGAVEDNVARAEEAIAESAAAGADLVALPEIFNVGYFAFDSYARRAESLSGPTLTTVAEAAREHDVAVLAGSIVEDLAATASETDAPVPETDGLANTTVFLDREGERRAVYRKRHLFGYGSAEQELLVAGQRLPTVEFEGFTVGMTTCYDLRFPEQYRDLVEAGVTLVVVPSAWPYPRVEHWETLSRARAIENQWFLAAVNGSGRFGETTLLGRSTVYDPWGTVLASSGDDPALVSATIDPERVSTVREEFPALQDRHT